MRRTDEHKIDRQFREGLTGEKGQVSFREEDWDAMEALLDKEGGRRGMVWLYWVSAGIAAVLLILMFRGFFVPDTGEKIVQKQKGKMKESTEQRESKGLNSSGPENERTAYRRERRVDTEETAGRAADTSSAPVADLTLLEAAGNSLSGVPAADSLPALAAIKAPLVPEITPVAGAPPAEQVVSDDLQSSPRKKVKLSLALVSAPDLNGVNSLANGQVGLNGGFLLIASLPKRWSVSTGLIYAGKPYQMNQGQLQGAYGSYGYGNRQTEHVDANCSVLDIPLNVSFQFLSKEKSSFSVGSGISSYIMLREKYSFTYSDCSTWAYKVSNKNSHFPGVVNFNATYQHRLGNKAGILVQPYYKLPLTKIGNEGIDLRSGGISVGMSWDIGRSTKK